MSFENFSIVRVFEENDFNFSFLGKNKKNILVVFEEGDFKEDVSYITKILSTAEIIFEDDCFFTTIPAEQQISPSLQMFFEKTGCDKIIIFGFSSLQFGSRLQNYINHVIQFGNFKVLFCENLERIKSSSKESKVQLRAGLQNLVNV